MATHRPILVTGAGGLIGRALVERLAAGGRAVLATDRALPPDPAPFEIVPAELEDGDRLAALVARGVDGIVHCGGISGPMVAPDRPAEIVRVNVLGTLHLLEAARFSRVRRFVYCSSLSAYGDTPPGTAVVREEAPLAAHEVYGASKAAADILVRAYARSHGLAAVVLRIGWLYGPRRRTASLLQRFIRDALDGRPTIVEHDGAYAPALVFIDDVVDALVAAYDAPRGEGRAFNVAGPERASFRELAAMVRKLVPRAEIRFKDSTAGSDTRHAAIDLGAALRELGWRPRIGLAEGIARTLAWLKEHPY